MASLYVNYVVKKYNEDRTNCVPSSMYLTRLIKPGAFAQIVLSLEIIIG